jgi:hypothetical protein
MSLRAEGRNSFGVKAVAIAYFEKEKIISRLFGALFVCLGTNIPTALIFPAKTEFPGGAYFLTNAKFKQ